MFLFENSGRQGFRRVVVFYLNHTLQNDRPRVEIFIDKMNRASGELYSVVDRLLMNI